MSVELFILTAHLVGDFILQTDWMASQKLERPSVRFAHVLVYHLPFIGLVLFFSPLDTLLFILASVVAHFVIDSRRWAEPKDELESYPIIVDQTLHLVTLTTILIVLQ